MKLLSPCRTSSQEPLGTASQSARPLLFSTSRAPSPTCHGAFDKHRAWLLTHSLSVFNSTLLLSAQVKRKLSPPVSLALQAAHHDRDGLTPECTGSHESYELHRGCTLPPASPASSICTRRLSSQDVNNLFFVACVRLTRNLMRGSPPKSAPLVTGRQLRSQHSCKKSRRT